MHLLKQMSVTSADRILACSFCSSIKLFGKSSKDRQTKKLFCLTPFVVVAVFAAVVLQHCSFLRDLKQQQKKGQINEKTTTSLKHPHNLLWNTTSPCLY
jgi:hypothetical protein